MASDIATILQSTIKPRFAVQHPQVTTQGRRNYYPRETPAELYHQQPWKNEFPETIALLQTIIQDSTVLMLI